MAEAEAGSGGPLLTTRLREATARREQNMTHVSRQNMAHVSRQNATKTPPKRNQNVTKRLTDPAYAVPYARIQGRLAARLAAPGAPLRDCAGVGGVEVPAATSHHAPRTRWLPCRAVRVVVGRRVTVD